MSSGEDSESWGLWCDCADKDHLHRGEERIAQRRCLCRHLQEIPPVSRRSHCDGNEVGSSWLTWGRHCTDRESTVPVKKWGEVQRGWWNQEVSGRTSLSKCTGESFSLQWGAVAQYLWDLFANIWKPWTWHSIHVRKLVKDGVSGD